MTIAMTKFVMRAGAAACVLALAASFARGFDDWALVQKYCPPGPAPNYPPPEV